MGHEVKLIAAQFVRPFVKTNKTDAADAEAIWEACQRPRMRFVAVKSAEQQAVLSLHRIRQQFVKIRTMQAHQVRGLLYEFGLVVPQGWRALLGQAGPMLADETRCAVPELVRCELLRQLDGIRTLTTRIAELERQIGSWQRRESECQRLAAIPGVGRLTASAVVATSLMRGHSARGASLPPSSAWCRGNRGPAAGSGSSGSASAAIRTCGRC